MADDFVLAVDQGTTSSRAIVFDGGYRIRGIAPGAPVPARTASGGFERQGAVGPRTSEDRQRGASNVSNLWKK